MKWLYFFLILSCSTNITDYKKEAEKAAANWFSHLDKGFFRQVFLESSPYLRDRINKGKMEEMLTSRLLMLGKMKNRTKKEETVLEKYRGLGRGQFISIDYISDFEQRISVRERIVLKKDGPTWKVFDYFFF